MHTSLSPASFRSIQLSTLVLSAALTACGGGAGGDSGGNGSSSGSGGTELPQPTPQPTPQPAPPAAPPASDTQAPSTPASLSATASSASRIGLSWSASTDNVGVARYQIERCLGSTCVALDSSGVAASFTDNGLAAASRYSYRVRALDAAGNQGAYSSAAAATTQAVPPVTAGCKAAAPGDAITAPFPTLTNISVEWAFTNPAADQGAEVSVKYRPAGSSTWVTGMPLRRIAAGTSATGYSWIARHTGSVFDVEPGTAYEIELTRTFADNTSITGCVLVTTRSVPVVGSGAATVVHNNAELNAALGLGSTGAGSIIELAPGAYTGFDVNKSGAAGQPLVIRGTPGARITGEITVFDQAHVMLTQLDVTGRIMFRGTRHMAVTRSTVQATVALAGYGIGAFKYAENAYIADNVVTGTTAWSVAALGHTGANLGEGILVTGPGHVIMNNRVANFRDNISFNEEDDAVAQYSIDILNNDLLDAADDAIEADYCFHNCRIMRNRITNAAMGVSSQPSLGGPTYFVRNVFFNITNGAFKLNNGSHGNVLLHNTVVKVGDAFEVRDDTPLGDLYSRNNLFIGRPYNAATDTVYAGYNGGNGDMLDLRALVLSSANLDYDGFGMGAGSAFTGNYGSEAGGSKFSSRAGLLAMPAEAHSVALGLDTFASAITLALPATLPHVVGAAIPALTLRAGSAAIDAGQAIPGVNSARPDLGAYEYGATVPIYGPRF